MKYLSKEPFSFGYSKKYSDNFDDIFRKRKCEEHKNYLDYPERFKKYVVDFSFYYMTFDSMLEIDEHRKKELRRGTVYTYDGHLVNEDNARKREELGDNS